MFPRLAGRSSPRLPSPALPRPRATAGGQLDPARHHGVHRRVHRFCADRLACLHWRPDCADGFGRHEHHPARHHGVRVERKSRLRPLAWPRSTGAPGLSPCPAADISGAGGALLASPVLTGTPAAPTAAAGVATTQLATCAFVAAALAATRPCRALPSPERRRPPTAAPHQHVAAGDHRLRADRGERTARTRRPG